MKKKSKKIMIEWSKPLILQFKCKYCGSSMTKDQTISLSKDSFKDHGIHRMYTDCFGKKPNYPLKFKSVSQMIKSSKDEGSPNKFSVGYLGFGIRFYKLPYIKEDEVIYDINNVIYCKCGLSKKEFPIRIKPGARITILKF